MWNVPLFMRPVASDYTLEVLSSSMWSTMMITGVFFMSFLLIFLSFKVFCSIKLASTKNGPIDISFLLSFSGIRYINNHVRHHLFETPLLSRRRFSSLSVSWLPQIFKKISSTSHDREFLSTFPAEENYVPNEKIRKNNSSSENHNARRYSTSSKPRRLLESHVHGNRHFGSSQTGIHAIEAKHNAPKNLRRNTMPNIILESSNSKENESILIKSDFGIQSIQKNIPPSFTDFNSNLNSIKEECFDTSETAGGNVKYEIEEKNSLKPFNENIKSENPYFSNEEDIIEKSNRKVPEISSINPAIQTQINMESLKQTSFRSAYFNYLPESIFGYTNGISKNIILSPNVSPPAENLSAPPGFPKRSSLDYKHSVNNNALNETTDVFSNHQPLYARRRTETYRALSHSAKPFITPDLISKYPTDSIPNRKNSSSPCLNDLQNTDDLFAPINWNFAKSNQTEALRRSWDSLEEEDVTSKQTNKQTPKLINECETKSSDPESQNNTFSSFFKKY